MKKPILLFIFILIIQVLFSQGKLPADNIEVGEPHGVVISKYSRYYYYENYILSVKFYRKEITLQTFDSKSLKQIKKEVFKGFPKEVVIEEIMRVKGKLVLFYSFYNEETDKESLYSRGINVEECSFEEEGRLIFEEEGNVDPIINTQQEVDNFNITISENQNKLFIQYKIKSKKEELIKIGFKVFDLNFKIEAEKTVELPYIESKIFNTDLILDSLGNTYILSFVSRGKSSNTSLQINYDVELFRIDGETGRLDQTRLKLDSTECINSMKFFKLNNKEIVCAGYSSIIGKNDKKNQTSGVFVIYDLHKNPISKVYPIPLNIVNQNVKQAKINTNKSLQIRYGRYYRPTIDFLVPEMLHLCNDGSILIVGEQQKPIIRNYATVGTGYHMLYEDVLFTKINQDGTLSWMKKLAKRQETTNRIKFDGLEKRGMSFKHVKGANHLYLLYSDHIKNLNHLLVDA